MNELNKPKHIYIYIKSAMKEGYEIAETWEDSINLSFLESKTRRGRVGKKLAQTLDTQCAQGIAIPVLTPDRPVKRQNGRRFKEDGEDMFTLTSIDRHGVAVSGDDAVEDIDTIYYPKRDCMIAIRKLTPKECFRLQAFSDEQFEKAEFVNTDSQLYHQAGNSVTTTIPQAIGEAINEQNT